MHEDLTSYDCIVLIITVYPHNINIKLQKSKILKNWFQLQLILLLTLHHSRRERERERKREI